MCVAVGTYTDKAGHIQWFTANETNGQWTTAVAVPYPALNQAVIETVWCSTGGLCASGGWYTDPATSATQAWVRTEARGHWQPGLEVPGIAALNVTNSPFGDYVALDAVSCTSPGNCAAGGQYTSTTSITDNGFPALQAFVVSETNGTWGTAQEVPGTATLNSAGGDANTTFITCASAGNCTAAGYFQGGDVTACDPPATPNDGPGPPPFPGCGTVFVVSEQHGVWRQAGATALADVLSLACPGAGNCVASGDIDVFTVSENQAGALVSESGGHLGNTLTITNTTSLNSVSCTSPGYCSAGGSSATNRAAVITEWGGRWGKAVGVSGLLPRSPGSIVNAVACPPRVVLCVAGGSEFTAKGGVQAFIVSQVTYRAG